MFRKTTSRSKHRIWIKPSYYCSVIIFCCSYLISIPPVLADDPEQTEQEESSPDIFPGSSLEDARPEPFFSFLDEPQRTVSYGLKSFTRAIDEFFANEKVDYETSGSYLRLIADSTYSEGGNTTTTGDLKLKLRLPVTQKKLKLVLESDPVEKQNELDRVRDRTTAGADQETNYYAGIQAEMGKKEKWIIKPGIGLRLRSPLDLYLKVRANRGYEINPSWTLNVYETLFTYDSSGFGSDTNFEFIKQVNVNMAFRSNTTFRYTDLNDYWELSQVFSLDHRLSSRRAVSYQAGVFGISEPAVSAQDYLLLVRYRQNIHSDYLFLEIAPQILYQKENDFHAEHSVLFRLEMFFRD